MKLCFVGYTEEINKGLSIISKRLGFSLSSSGDKVEVSKIDVGYEVVISDGKYLIAYSKKAEFFRALSILIYKIREGVKKFTLNEFARFDTCGTMIDVSRNAVLTVDATKDIIERIALMGLNMVMLYTEDTYQMEKYPWFGYMRGAYTKEELKEIDAYGEIFGIELIPCIQTLAHLATTLHWPYASKMKDQSNILLVDAPETYEFIEEMFKVYSECFKSRRIHIGMDEAVGVGMGNFFKKNGYQPPFEIMTRHIRRVVEIAEKYGYDPMMWSDMFFRVGKYHSDYHIDSEAPENSSELIPENLEMIYWDYCYADENVTDTIIEKHKVINRNVVFCGGIWTWDRLTVSLKKTFDTARTQLAVCKRRGIKTVFATIWGSGSSNAYNIYSTLPGLQMYAEQNYSDTVSDQRLGEMFKICTGYNLSDYMLLSIDDFSEEDTKKYLDPELFCFCVNSSIQHFYNDVLTGLLDKTHSGFDFRPHYQRYLDSLNNIGDVKDMKELFELHKILCEILVVKCGIGVRLTEAYKSGDHETMTKIVGELEYLLGKYKAYHLLTGDLWHKTYKPFGYDVLDMHLAGIESRVFWAIHRVKQYLNGEVKKLEELEAERFYYREIKSPLLETTSTKMYISASAT